MNKPLKILITNDDGIYAKGIDILIEIVKNKLDCELFIVAPLTNQSAKSMAFSHRHPVAISQIFSEPGISKWAVEGTPVDCSKLGLNVVFEDTLPDIVLSGINNGSNAGQNVLYSGTAGAALDAALKGVPAIAFSQVGHIDSFQKEPGGDYIKILIDYLLAHPMKKPNCLNVNFPSCDKYLGLRLTTPGHEFCVEDPCLISKERSRDFYMIGSKTEGSLNDASDEYRTLIEGYITVAPFSPLDSHKIDGCKFQEKRNIFDDFVDRHPSYTSLQIE
ncbi:MAG: 5'/3'-nucleotidase SurE [Victivallaceae bacterium]